MAGLSSAASSSFAPISTCDTADRADIRIGAGALKARAGVVSAANMVLLKIDLDKLDSDSPLIERLRL